MSNIPYGAGVKYDFLHSEKNYKAEASFLDHLFKKYNIFNTLDVGCGTGNHCDHLETLGYRCLGIDPCSTMIKVAKTKKGNYKHCTIENFQSNYKFDSCISLFNVINHITSLNQLNIFFNKISSNVKPQGLFVFDCFNSISFNKESPLPIQNPTHSIVPKFDYSKGTLNLISTSEIPEFNYTINHRIWSIDVIRELLDNNQFKLLGIYKPFTYDKLNLNTDFSYKIQFIAQKIN